MTSQGGEGEPAGDVGLTPLEQRRKVIQDDVRRMLLLGSQDASRPETREVRNFQQLVGYTFLIGTILGGMRAIGRESAAGRVEGAGSADQLRTHQTRAARMVRGFVMDGILLGARASIMTGALVGSSICVGLLSEGIPDAVNYAAGGALTGAAYSLGGRLGLRTGAALIAASAVGGAVMGATLDWEAYMKSEEEKSQS